MTHPGRENRLLVMEARVWSGAARGGDLHADRRLLDAIRLVYPDIDAG